MLSAVTPQPQPIGVPEVGRFCFAFRGGLPEVISSILEWIITEKHGNGWLFKLTKQIVLFIKL